MALLLPILAATPFHDLVGFDSKAGLGTNKVISSGNLGYDLQYRVFVPDNVNANRSLPVLFVTDGQWYIETGELPEIMAHMMESGEIRPAVAVFVDNRDPGNLSVNRRNDQFFCNERYVRFFQEELIPSIESEYNVRSDREGRTILGLSFGGLNAACFGLMAPTTFGNIAMQSPATHPIQTIHSSYRDSSNLDLKIFLSTGTDGDNEGATRRLRDILRGKNYEMAYVEVPYGHTWANWKPLLDDVLRFYYGSVNSEE